jgi:choline dehydrogenase-like flavoprotein
MRLRRRRSKPAFRRATISTAATTKASATSKSIRNAACAGTASTAFLRPVQRRRNLEVRTGAMVTRLVIERRADGALHAAGVEVRTVEGAQRLRASRAVVLAAGAIGSPHADAAPKIEPNYLSTEGDRLVAAQSLRLTRRIAVQPALAAYAPRELKPGVEFETDEALSRLAGDIGTTIFHPVGTCRMGGDDDAQAVLDARLRVRGVHGLVVADASAMPTITSGNTNAPTLMIAERAAQWLRAGPSPSA